MGKPVAELLLEAPNMWREGDLIFVEVQTAKGALIRAYKIDIATQTYARCGQLIREFHEEQAETLRLDADRVRLTGL